MSTPPTNAEADAAVPVAGTPVRALTNAFLKDVISTLALKLNLSSVAAAVQTFLTTPSSANLRAAVTDETGTGSLVFGTGPTISALNNTGITTSDGANVTTPNAIVISSNTGVIDVTKGLNTASNGADTTLTMSGSPATAQTWTYVECTNSDGTNSRTWTIPSATPYGSSVAITSMILPPSTKAMLFYKWNGTAWNVMGNLVALSYVGIQYTFATGADQTDEVVLAMPFAGNFVSITTDCDSGTATYVVRNATTAVNATGSASVTSTKSTQALSGTVSFSAGDTVSIVRSANSSCVNGRFTLFVSKSAP